MHKTLLILTTIESLALVYANLITVFGIIFFYQFFGTNILGALLPFGISHLAYALLVPYSTKLAGKLGVRNILLLAMALFIITAPIIYVFDQTAHIGFIIAWFIFFYAAKLCFHPAMIYILGSITSHAERGKQMSMRSIILMGTITLTPIVGGFISESYGFLGIVALSVFMILLAIIPITYLENTKFETKLNFRKLLRMPAVRKLWTVNGLFELQLTGERIWPVYIFVIFGGSFIAVGNLVGITAGITIIAMFLLGSFLDKHNRLATLRKTYYLNSLSWFGRVLATLPETVAISNLIGRITKDLAVQTLDTVNYDLMNDGITVESRDELIVMREVGINIAIGSGAIILGLIFQHFGFPVGFVIVGVTGFGIALVRK